MTNKLAFTRQIALILALIAIPGLSSLAGAGTASQDSSNDFSHVVTREQDGDIIRILEVRGPSDTIMSATPMK